MHQIPGFATEYAHLFVLIGGLLVFSARVATGSNTRLRIAGEFSFVWAMALSYFVVRGMGFERVDLAFSNADQLIAFERRVGIFHEAAIQSQTLNDGFLRWFADWVYVWWHWPLIVVVLVWLYLKHPEHYPHYRNAFLISGAIGILLFAALPVAPPRFLPELGFVDTVDKRAIFSNILLPPSLTNEYAAMPSLHAGWNLLIGIALFRHARGYAMRAFGIGMPVLMFWSIVATGNHYIVDGLAGDLIAEGSLLAAIWIASSRRSLDPQESPSDAWPDIAQSR